MRSACARLPARRPISSVYQYFPDKGALLLAIMEEYYGLMHSALRDTLESVTELDQIAGALQRALRRYADFFRDDPGLINLWSGLQADPRLVQQDVEDTYRNAEYCVELLRPMLPGAPRAELRAFGLFFMHSLGSLIRFVLLVDDRDGRAVLKEASRLIELRLRDLIERY